MDVTKTHILIVDDDKNYALSLKGKLEGMGVIEIVHDEGAFIKKFKPYRYDLVILDLKLKEGKEGLVLLSYIMDEDPTTAVIVNSGWGDIATAVEALHMGARTFLEKRLSVEDLRLKVEQTLKEVIARRKIKRLEPATCKDEIIGEDPNIEKIKDMIRLVAQDGETTVLIRGETGTGKELVARAISCSGVRSKGPFISIALTDLNKDTITSELFGHEKGAFTGAIDKHNGCFEQAHKGLLFIDEIGELPPELQIKLLRVLDNKKFRRMGATQDTEVDVQLVTATNRPLEEMLKVETFRQDLYYRLKVFEITLPPLRERQGDIHLLAGYFLDRLLQKGRSTAVGFNEEALKLMLHYRWPGNVRELKAVVESAALRSKLVGNNKITPKHLIPLLMDKATEQVPVLTMDRTKNTGGGDRDIERALADKEMSLIEEALIKSGGRKTEAWKLLNYKNRFAMTRRVKKIMTTYPDILDKYSEIKAMYLLKK
ncbi:MAG: sigma-54-dependent Fis family transcriptional regulator [Nitrospirae bacterium]|nr:sigma-54-dependent Fis family transcriptional regulator [Nitrospirota bacterium]